MNTHESLAGGVELMSYRYAPLGLKLGRNVTVLPLSSGDLVIHSTAPFTEEDVAHVSSLGKPRWILDATHFHDTYVKHRRAFPDATYLGPDEVFAADLDLWGDEITVLPIAGMPKINETLLLHRPTGTLVVADLVFNIPDSAGKWTRGGLRMLSGIEKMPGNSRLFRKMITDWTAFHESLERVFEEDFETVVVGHGVPIRENAKEQLRAVFEI